jgi:hypothetical protein
MAEQSRVIVKIVGVGYRGTIPTGFEELGFVSQI